MIQRPRPALLYGAHWAVEEGYAGWALDQMAQIEFSSARRQEAMPDETEARPGYEVVDGVAVVRMEGPMTKQPTCAGWLFGGCSTLETRHALRTAERDPAVHSILLSIDSPGGQVAGTFDLADEVARANACKPVVACISDLCASAAYAVASQAGRIIANRTALVGSLGTYLVLVDSSTAAEQAGVRVHVLRSGAFKGAGTPGTVVTEAHLAEFQRVVETINAQFMETVSRGRGLDLAAVCNLADGRVFVGEEALSAGLIDAVGDWEMALRSLTAAGASSRKGGSHMGLRSAWQTLKAGITGARAGEQDPGEGNPGSAEIDRTPDEALGPEEEGTAPAIEAEWSDKDGGAGGTDLPSEGEIGAGSDSEHHEEVAAGPSSPGSTHSLRAESLSERGRELAAARAELLALQEQARTVEREHTAGLLAGLKAAGALAPAAEGAASALLRADRDAFLTFMAQQGRLAAFARPEDLPRAGPPANAGNGAALAAERQGEPDPGQLLGLLAEAKMNAEPGLLYPLAFARACSERPDLAGAHLAAQRRTESRG